MNDIPNYVNAQIAVPFYKPHDNTLYICHAPTYNDQTSKVLTSWGFFQSVKILSMTSFGREVKAVGPVS